MKTIIIAILILGLTGCAQPQITTTTNAVQNTPMPTNSHAPAPAKEYKIGDVIELGDTTCTVMGCRKNLNATDYYEADKMYFLVDLLFESHGAEEKYIDVAGIKLQDSEGYSYADTLLANGKGNIYSKLFPSKKLRGEVGFVIPQSAKGLELSIKIAGSKTVMVVLDP
jgi:hypothetical protein